MSNCLFCGQEVEASLSISFLLSFQRMDEPLICASCLDKFERIDWDRACPGCSRAQNEKILCSDCQLWQEKYPSLILKHRALFRYHAIAQEYLKQYKVQGDLLLAELFKKEIRRELKDYEKSHQIFALPMSEASMNRRGFNQVTVLLEAAGIAYQEPFLHKGGSKKQSRKNRAERLNSPQFFAWKEDYILDENNPKILLVDDIYTTGRTLIHAKNLIFEKQSIMAEQSVSIESFTLFR